MCMEVPVFSYICVYMCNNTELLSITKIPPCKIPTCWEMCKHTFPAFVSGNACVQGFKAPGSGIILKT